LILSIDETVRNPQSEEAQRLKKAGPGAAGGASRNIQNAMRRLK
jgi:hypothetical protein